MVVTEVIDDHEEDLLTLVEHREEDAFEDVGRHEGAHCRLCFPAESGCRGGCEPRLVILLNKLGESGVGLGALHVEHFAHGGVHILQVEVPFGECALYRHPFLQGLRRVYHVGYVAELLPIGLVGVLAENVVLMDMLFKTQQYLTGVDRFDEIVGDFLTDSLLHDTLLLALGNHHHGQLGVQALDLLQGFQSRQTGHVLVQENDIQRLLPANVNSVLSVGSGQHFIVFTAKIDKVGGQEVDFIVRPKDSVHRFYLFMVSGFKFNLELKTFFTLQQCVPLVVAPFVDKRFDVGRPR